MIKKIFGQIGAFLNKIRAILNSVKHTWGISEKDMKFSGQF